VAEGVIPSRALRPTMDSAAPPSRPVPIFGFEALCERWGLTATTEITLHQLGSSCLQWQYALEYSPPATASSSSPNNGDDIRMCAYDAFAMLFGGSSSRAGLFHVVRKMCDRLYREREARGLATEQSRVRFLRCQLKPRVRQWALRLALTWSDKQKLFELYAPALLRELGADVRVNPAARTLCVPFEHVPGAVAARMEACPDTYPVGLAQWQMDASITRPYGQLVDGFVVYSAAMEKAGNKWLARSIAVHIVTQLLQLLLDRAIACGARNLIPYGHPSLRMPIYLLTFHLDSRQHTYARILDDASVLSSGPPGPSASSTGGPGVLDIEAFHTASAPCIQHILRRAGGTERNGVLPHAVAAPLHPKERHRYAVFTAARECGRVTGAVLPDLVRAWAPSLRTDGFQNHEIAQKLASYQQQGRTILSAKSFSFGCGSLQDTSKFPPGTGCPLHVLSTAAERATLLRTLYGDIVPSIRGGAPITTCYDLSRVISPPSSAAGPAARVSPASLSRVLYGLFLDKQQLCSSSSRTKDEEKAAKVEAATRRPYVPVLLLPEEEDNA